MLGEEQRRLELHLVLYGDFIMDATNTQFVVIFCPYLRLHGRHPLASCDYRADDLDSTSSRHWSVKHEVQRSTDAHIIPEPWSRDGEQSGRAKVVEYGRGRATVQIPIFVA